MNIVCLPVGKAVQSARKPIAREAFDLFREGLERLFDKIDQRESGERLRESSLISLATSGAGTSAKSTRKRGRSVIDAGRSSVTGRGRHRNKAPERQPGDGLLTADEMRVLEEGGRTTDG